MRSDHRNQPSDSILFSGDSNISRLLKSGRKIKLHQIRARRSCEARSVAAEFPLSGSRGWDSLSENQWILRKPADLRRGNQQPREAIGGDYSIELFHVYVQRRLRSHLCPICTIPGLSSVNSIKREALLQSYKFLFLIKSSVETSLHHLTCLSQTKKIPLIPPHHGLRNRMIFRSSLSSKPTSSDMRSRNLHSMIRIA